MKSLTLVVALHVVIVAGLGLAAAAKTRANPPVQAEPAWDRPETRALAVGPANEALSNLARSYNEMMARLESFFTRYASHELRNPLAGLRL